MARTVAELPPGRRHQAAHDALTAEILDEVITYMGRSYPG